MPKPWEESWDSAPAPAPAAPAAPEAPRPDGLYDDGLEVTVTDDAPWEDFGEEGLTGSVTYDPLENHSLEGAREREKRGMGDSLWRGLQSGALMGFDDEWQAGWGAAGNKLGSALGLNASTASLGDIYQQILAERRRTKDEALEDNPLSYGAGFLPGTLMSGFALPGARGVGASATGWRGAAHAAGQGAMGGALSGAGNSEGGLFDRFSSAASGAALGGPMGAMAYPLTQFASNVAGRAWRGATGRMNPNSGLDRMAEIAPQDPAAMRNYLSQHPDARLVDMVTPAGRRVMRQANYRLNDEATNEFARHADQVYSGAQDRVVEAARRNMTANPQTARQLSDEIMGDPDIGVRGARGEAFEAAVEPFRGRPVNLADETKLLLAMPEGQAAIRFAVRSMPDPAERAVAMDLLAASRRAARGPADPEDAFRAEVRGWDDLPDAIKDAYRAQRPDLMEAADPFADIPITADLVDKVRRGMRDMSVERPAIKRVANDFSRQVDDDLRASVPEWGDAIDNYAAQSRVGEAAGGAGRYSNSDFLSTPADDYASRVAMAQGAEAVEDGALSEADALLLRARDDVVDRATAGGGQGAGGVARQIASGGGETGAGQAARNRTLLGEEGAERLQNDMGYEVDRVRNTDFIDPGRGSRTASVQQDEAVAGFIDTAATLATAGKWGVVKEVRKWLSNADIKGVDAERLTRDAISTDPARIQAAIQHLEARGMARVNAHRFVNAMSAINAGRAAGATQGGENDYAQP